MKINNIGYLFKEGIRGIFLHGFMSFAAVCITVACLLIVGTFSSIVYNVNEIVKDLNMTNEVLVYIDETVPLEEAKSVETKIRALDNILSADFKSNQEALEDFSANYEGGLFGGVDASYLRHRVIVKLDDNAFMEKTVSEIEKIPGVAQVSAAFELAEFFSTLQRVLQVASIAVIGALLLVSLVIISNTVKLGMHERRDEIAIMKVVGATNGFIRLPFVVEGFTLGMLGATVAFGLEWLLYDWVCDRLEMMTALNLITLVPFVDLLTPMVITFAAAGLFVGIIGSWTSIQKFMNV